ANVGDEGQSHVFAARFDDAGAALDPSGILLSGGFLNEFPEVASNGQDHFVVWASEPDRPVDGNATEVRGARISTVHGLLDPEPLLIATETSVLSNSSFAGGERVTSDGNGFLEIGRASCRERGEGSGGGAA